MFSVNIKKEEKEIKPLTIDDIKPGDIFNMGSNFWYIKLEKDGYVCLNYNGDMYNRNNGKTITQLIRKENIVSIDIYTHDIAVVK